MFVEILRCLPFLEQSYKKGNPVYSATSMKVTKPTRDIFTLYKEPVAHLSIFMYHLEHCQCSMKASTEITIMATKIDSLCGKKNPQTADRQFNVSVSMLFPWILK